MLICAVFKHKVKFIIVNVWCVSCFLFRYVMLVLWRHMGRNGHMVLWWLHSSTGNSMRCRNRLNLTFQKAPHFRQFSTQIELKLSLLQVGVVALRFGRCDKQRIQWYRHGKPESPGISHGISPSSSRRYSENAQGQPKQKKPVEAAADWTVQVCIVQWFLFVPGCTSASSVAPLEDSQCGECTCLLQNQNLPINYILTLHNRDEEKLPSIVFLCCLRSFFRRRRLRRTVSFSSPRPSEVPWRWRLWGPEVRRNFRSVFVVRHVAMHMKIVVWNEVCFWKPQKRLRRMWWIELPSLRVHHLFLRAASWNLMFLMTCRRSHNRVVWRLPSPPFLQEAFVMAELWCPALK